VCDLVCGLYLALAVTAALRERDRSGVGQSIDVSLFEAGVSLAVWEAGKYFATGEVGGPLGSAHQSQAPYQAFRTADGWITIGANTPNTWAGFCRTLALDDAFDDERYADATKRHALREELQDLIETRTTTRTTADLEAALGAAGVPCAPINDYGQVFTDDHLTARDFFWDAPHPALPPQRQLGNPMRLSASPPVREHAGPPLGADTRAVLTRAGVPADVVDAVCGANA
jgi:crotonobetainyl-CoA:carnitine CoA-transferase CaiB-like acyl-CoA transferase